MVVQFIWMDEIATIYIPNPNSERGQNDVRMEEMKASLEEIKQGIQFLRDSIETQNMQKLRENDCATG